MQLVLIVEDEALIRDLLWIAFEDAGFKVATAATAADGVQQASDRDLCALVTDIKLGGPSTGWDVAREVRTHSPDLPIVYVTGDSSHDWAAQGVPRSLLVSKPFRPSQVVRAVATLLDLRSTSAGPNDCERPA